MLKEISLLRKATALGFFFPQARMHCYFYSHFCLVLFTMFTLFFFLPLFKIRNLKISQLMEPSKILNYWCLYDCIYVFSTVHFVILMYLAEIGHEGRGRALEVCCFIFEATPPMVKGHQEVKLPYNALWLSTFVWQNP